jgi:hypothetical protein
MVRFLLSHGANPGAVDKTHRRTALHVAVLRDHWGVMLELLCHQVAPGVPLAQAMVQDGATEGGGVR